MNYNMLWLPIRVALASVFFCGAAHAVTLSATAVNVVAGTDQWRFDYGLQGPLDIDFGVNLTYSMAEFADVKVVTPWPAADIEYTLTTDSGFDGLLTLKAPNGLASNYATNFSVSFTKLTPSPPGIQSFTQPFEVVDHDFNFVSDGNFTITGLPSPVPEPSEAALLLLGAVAVAVAQWRRSRAV